MIVSPEIDAVTFASTRNTRLALLPLTESRFAPGPVIVVVAVVPVKSSWPLVRVIVRGVAKTVGSNVIAAPPSVSARLTAWRRLTSPEGEPVPSMVELTTRGLVWNAPMSRASEASGTPRWSVVIGVLVPG